LSRRSAATALVSGGPATEPARRFSVIFTHPIPPMNRPLGLLLLTLALAAGVGCQQGGDKPAYANVSGTVTYNGQPIEKGQITFASDGRPPSTTEIIGGKFNGQAVIGSNKIMVSAKRKGADTTKLPKGAEGQIKGYKEYMKGKSDPGAGEIDPGMVEYIPPEWGSESKQVRVVEAGGANEFKFEITGPKR